MTLKIEINDRTDRESLALILVKAGYTVKIIKQKANSKTVNYVCYETEEENENKE